MTPNQPSCALSAGRSLDEPGENLDIKVAVKLGWTKKDFELLNVFNLPAYSTQIEKAWITVEHAAEFMYLLHLEKISHKQQGYTDHYGTDGKWNAWFENSKVCFHAVGDTAPHAICLAFLALELEIQQ